MTEGEKPASEKLPDPATVTRKLAAKRSNEHAKSVYAFANTLGAAVITAAAIIPAVNSGPEKVSLDAPTWFAFGLSLHAFGHFVIRVFWESEE